VSKISTKIGVCKLCKKSAELQLSHIVPKFVGKWIKKSSASGYFRNAVNPNLRIQDLYKENLLCKDCEEKFSSFETYFAEKIFYPFQNGTKKLFHYDTWLQKFVISVNWRVAISGLNKNIPDNHPSKVLLDKTLETWRKFLIDEINNPGSNKHHVIFVGITDIKEFYKIQPAPYDHFTNMRILRSADFGTILDNYDRVFIFSNLCGIFLVSHIYPKSFNGWTSQTKVIKRGTIKTLQTNYDDKFGKFLAERLSLINNLIENNISEKQKQKIHNGVLGDINKTLNSKSLGIINQIIKPHSHRSQ